MWISQTHKRLLQHAELTGRRGARGSLHAKQSSEETQYSRDDFAYQQQIFLQELLLHQQQQAVNSSLHENQRETWLQWESRTLTPSYDLKSTFFRNKSLLCPMWPISSRITTSGKFIFPQRQTNKRRLQILHDPEHRPWRHQMPQTNLAEGQLSQGRTPPKAADLLHNTEETAK